MEILVISSFPPRGSIHHKKLVGVASYAKNTLTSLKKLAPDLGITVLAEELPSDSEDSSFTVKRVWKRGSILSYLNLFQAISAHKKARTVLIEFELAMFGGTVSLLLFPLFLLALKLQGKKIVTVLHQVMVNINEMHGHVGLPKDSILSYLINFCIRVFYSFVLSISNTVIVFDTYLKDTLSRFGDKDKIVVIPHGVESFPTIPSKEDARKKLNIPQNTYVLLYFGYIAWYKGTDLLVGPSLKLKVQSSKLQIIIAGGPNPNHVDKPFYKKYVESIEQAAKKTGIQITGFVDEKDIPYYFSASDAVVLPYRTYMSSSGPLSLAFSFHKPFIVSENLKDIFKTPDLKAVIEKNNASDDLFVYNNLEEKMPELKKSQEKMENVAKDIALKRSWENIAPLYYEVLTG